MITRIYKIDFFTQPLWIGFGVSAIEELVSLDKQFSQMRKTLCKLTYAPVPEIIGVAPGANSLADAAGPPDGRPVTIALF